MKYLLVVSDMDGTLLRTDGQIADRTIRAIDAYVSAGGHFTLATGRGIAAARPYAQRLGLKTPAILANGSLLWDPVKDQVLAYRELALPTLARIWPILSAHSVAVLIHAPRGTVTHAITPAVQAHLIKDGITVDVKPDLDYQSVEPVVKILTIGAPPELDKLERALLGTGAAIELVRSDTDYLEVLPPGGGKEAALDDLVRHLGLERSETIALGDYLNDLGLLERAGLGVAMANAHPAVQARAQRLTGSNDEDGVAQVLEALVEGHPVGLPCT